MVKSLRVAVRGADDEGQDDWISPALPPLAMIKQARNCAPVVLVYCKRFTLLFVAFVNSAKEKRLLKSASIWCFSRNRAAVLVVGGLLAY